MEARKDRAVSNRVRLWKGWEKVIYMFGAFVLGVTFAISHHLFHAGLDGELVTSRTQQQWYGRVSLGFALLVRYCFKIAVAIAIVQGLWYSLKTKASDIGTVDTVSKMLSNPTSFFTNGIWSFSFPLALLALLSWFLPYATIIAPPTLGTITGPVASQDIQYPVPRINFDYGTGLHSWYVGQADADIVYTGPHPDLHRLALMTAASGSIQPIVPTWSNATYNITFYGPSLKCQPYAVQGVSALNWNGMVSSYLYYASAPLGVNFTDQLKNLTNMSDPASSDISLQKIVPFALDSAYYSSLNQNDTRFYVFYDHSQQGDVSENLANGTDVQECRLYNSSYDLQFRYENGHQTVDLKKVVEMNQLNSTYNPPGYSNNCDAVSQPLDCIVYNNRFKYQSVFHSLTQLLIGFIVELGPLEGGDGIHGYTSLFETGLIYTQEFNVWRNESGTTTPTNFFHLNNLTLPQGIEQLMQNITVSLLSASQFTQQNPTNVSVQIFAPSLVYNYQWQNLAIGYSTCATFTFLTICFGIWNVARNRAVYSNSISSITAHHAILK